MQTNNTFLSYYVEQNIIEKYGKIAQLTKKSKYDQVYFGALYDEIYSPLFFQDVLNCIQMWEKKSFVYEQIYNELERQNIQFNLNLSSKQLNHQHQSIQLTSSTNSPKKSSPKLLPKLNQKDRVKLKISLMQEALYFMYSCFVLQKMSDEISQMLLVCNDLILSMDLEKEQLNLSKSNQEQVAQIQKLQLLLSHMNQNYTNGEPIQQFMKNYKIILAEVLDIKNQEEEEQKIRQGYIEEFGPIKTESAFTSLNSFTQLDAEFHSKSNLHLSLQNQGFAIMEEGKSFDKSPFIMTNSANLQQISSFPSSPIKHISLLGSFNEEKPKKSPLIFGKLKSLRSDTNLKTSNKILSTNIFEQETPETKCATFYSANESKENQLSLSSRNNSPLMFSTSNPLFFKQVNNYPNLSDNVMDEEVPINSLEQIQQQSPLVTSRKNTIQSIYQQHMQGQVQQPANQPMMIPQQVGNNQTVNQQFMKAQVNENFQQPQIIYQNIENINGIQFQNQNQFIQNPLTQSVNSQLHNSINLIQSQNFAQNPQIYQQQFQQQQFDSQQQISLFQQQNQNSLQIPFGSNQQMQQSSNSIQQLFVSQQQPINSLEQVFGSQQQFAAQQQTMISQKQQQQFGQQQIQQLFKPPNNMNFQQNNDTQNVNHNRQNTLQYIINQQNNQNQIQLQKVNSIESLNKANLQQNSMSKNNSPQQFQQQQQQQSIFNTLKNYKPTFTEQRQTKQNALHQLFQRVSPLRSTSQQRSNQNSLNSSEIQNISPTQPQNKKSQPQNTNQLKNILGLPTSPENQQQSLQRGVPKSCISLFPSQITTKGTQNANIIQSYNNNGISLTSQKNSNNNSMCIENPQTVGISLVSVGNGNSNILNNKNNNDKSIGNFFNQNNNNSSTYNLAQTVMLHLQNNNASSQDQNKGKMTNYQNNFGNSQNYLKNQNNQNNDNNYSQYLVPRMQPDQQHLQSNNSSQGIKSLQNQIKPVYGKRLSKQQSSINTQQKLIIDNDTYHNDSNNNSNMNINKSTTYQQNQNSNMNKKTSLNQLNNINNNSNLHQYIVNSTNLTSSTKNGNVQNNAYNYSNNRSSQPSLIQPSTGLRFQRQQNINLPQNNNLSKTQTTTQNNSLNSSFKSNAFNGRSQFGLGTHRISTNTNYNN